MERDSSSGTLQIKEEQLDIAKKWIQTGDIKVHKETFSEERNFTIPIEHEELIIEKKSTEAEPVQVIRIPISEEKVEFSKHKVVLEDVSIYRQQIDDIKHIEETLKKENPKIKVSGSPRIINK